MIKVEYTLAKDELSRRYISHMAPHTARLQGLWSPHQQFLENASGNTRMYPLTIDELLTADFDRLNRIYENYVSLRKSGVVDEARHMNLKLAFPYSVTNIIDSLQPYIADFFMNPLNGFEIHTCHYCDTAYVNVYGALAGYSSVLELVNNAPPEELQSLIRNSSGGCISDKTVSSIVKNRPYATEDDFNRLGVWHGCSNKGDDVRKDVMNHFDLDHVLPKGECPLVGLSLFNFVPSCQVCNEKLKRRKPLGNNEELRRKLSPTSDLYDFRNQVNIVIQRRDGGVPKLDCLQHASEYRISFEYVDKDYAKSVSLFRLNERYNYHKVEALRLHDLLSDYSGYITMLHQLFEGKGLGGFYTEEKIGEDLFGENYNRSFHRCFGKLHEDILKTFRKRGVWH